MAAPGHSPPYTDAKVYLPQAIAFTLLSLCCCLAVAVAPWAALSHYWGDQKNTLLPYFLLVIAEIMKHFLIVEQHRGEHDNPELRHSTAPSHKLGRHFLKVLLQIFAYPVSSQAAPTSPGSKSTRSQRLGRHLVEQRPFPLRLALCSVPGVFMVFTLILPLSCDMLPLRP